MEPIECVRIFPDGKERKGFINEEGTYCVIKVWNEVYRFPVETPKVKEEA